MRSFSRRIIYSEDLPTTSPWRPATLSGHAGSDTPFSNTDEPAPPPPPSYEDGLREGQQAGVEQARAEFAQQHQAELAALGQAMNAVTQAYTDQLAQLQQTLADDVLALAVAMARSVVATALRVQPTLIAPAVEASLGALLEGAEPATLRLNPADLAIVQGALGSSLRDRPLHLVADATLRAGGCVVETRHQRVDAQVESRWQHALAALGITDTWIEAES